MQCVDQDALEDYDGISKGKYTIGLGQTKMSFCDDREGKLSFNHPQELTNNDVDGYSIALTVLSSLMKKHEIDPKSIGRLEVGTETILDKSKSCKSVLMQLFEPSGNTNIEGVDTFNACYGGTNAVFNAINWIESSAWDGRDAIVVAADIALYDKGNARPTGGAGGVALLIGANAPIVFDPGMRGSYMRHTYDFYKADLAKEFPFVNGHFSTRCYTEALDGCYKAYYARRAILEAAANATTKQDSRKSSIDIFDHVVFHSPTCKTVVKAYARMLYNDYLSDPENPAFRSVPAELKAIKYEESLANKSIETYFMGLTKERFNARVQPSLKVANLCGNMYCGSVYAALISLLCGVGSEKLQGKKIGIFSYGGGLASSLFSVTVKGDINNIIHQVDLEHRLNERIVLLPKEYDEVSLNRSRINIAKSYANRDCQICSLREESYLKNSYKPKGSIARLAPGTYYLAGVDEAFRRSYAVKI